MKDGAAPKTTKTAYLQENQNTTQSINLATYYHVDKSTQRVFLTPHALSCGAVDVQKTMQGYVVIQKLPAGNAYRNAYRNKKGYLLGTREFRTLGQARRHLTYKEGE